jgi:O-antigen ligase/tetratricopeptide (TPR) repeat protein
LALVALVAFLVLWTLLWGGAFFDVSQFGALWQAAVALALVSALAFLERRRLRATPIRLAAMALWLAYVLALCVAVAPRPALQEIVKFGLFSVTLLAVSELTRSESGHAQPARVAFLVWVAVALFELLSLGLAFTPLYHSVARGGRLYTLMGYPNSAGALAGAAYLLGLGLRRSLASASANSPASRSSRLGAALAAGQWLHLVTLILTASRGAWLVMPAGVAVVLILWPRGDRLAPLGETAILGLAALATAVFLPSAFAHPVLGVPLLLVGLAAGVVAGRLAGRFEVLRPKRQAALAGVAVAAVVILGLGLFQMNAIPRLLVSRLANIDLSSRSAVERLVWSRDALAVIGDHPVLGVGGGGWASVYFQYQSYGYSTKEVHNDFLEIWVETGTVGLAAWLALLGASGWTVYRLLRRQRRPLVAGLAGGAGMLILHSGLDFNLALGAMGIFIWSLLGIIDGMEIEERDRDKPGSGGRRAEAASDRGGRRTEAPPVPAWPWLAVLGLTFGLVILSLSLFVGQLEAIRAGRLYEQGQASRARDTLLRATSFDPWSASLRMNQALVAEALFLQTKDPRYIAEARSQAERVLALDPQAPNSHSFYAGLAFKYGAMEQGLAEAEKALALQPFEPKRYSDVARMRVLIAEDRIRGGKLEEAGQVLSGVPDLLDRAVAQAAKVPAYAPSDSVFPALPPDLALYAGQTELLLGRSEVARTLLEVAYASDRARGTHERDVEVVIRHAEAALWLSALAESQGRPGLAAGYLQQASGAIPDAGAARDMVLGLLGQLGAEAQ